MKMDKLLEKKINLLLHLAKIDGKFDLTEQKVLEELIQENGLNDAYMKTHVQKSVNLQTLSKLHGKAEIIYWVLKMIKADDVLHPDELAYTKALTIKLNYKAELVDYYSNHSIPEFQVFEKQIRRFEKEE